MKQSTQFWIVSGITLCTLATTSTTRAQIVPDATLPVNSSVTTEGSTSIIAEGTRSGSNLFHSFEQFSIPTGRTTYFNNTLDIQNIISRVTGSSVSNIDGLLQANGAANLFLLNPNGIIFGENASLNVNGSFVATTANVVQFGSQGIFSATNSEAPSLLTVNPTALLFNQINRNAAVINQAILRVRSGKNFSLIGGDVSLNGGRIIAPGGRVELGGLSTVGAIGINNDGSLNFPDGVARSDIYLTDEAFVNVAASDGGAIAINANNLRLAEGSQLRSGIASDLESPEARGGNITINSTGEVTLNQQSSIISQVLENGIGNGGNINIQASSLDLKEVSIISASTFGEGDGGVSRLVLMIILLLIQV